MSWFMRCAAASVCGLLAALPAWAQEIPTRDLAGSHDSPIVSRFAGSVIIGYHTSDYDQLVLPLGQYANGAISRTETAEGKITSIAYVVPAGKSLVEVWRNYQGALTRAGFQTRFFCHANDGQQGCGSAFDMSHQIGSEALINSLSTLTENNNLMINTLWPTGGNAYIATARLSRPSDPVDVVLLISQNDQQPVGVLLQICESKPMSTGEVTVDAKAMSQGLQQEGHIALYGIHFANDSATLATDSADTLAQMVTLLKGQPALRVYIVGHTDNAGTLAHNLALSQQRAEAVVKALAARGIAADRMSAKGLASYAPVASNESDAGRAKNRRVELVRQ
jgi:outer membrane protein OmpA-like peptidoglycan-associated protein